MYLSLGRALITSIRITHPANLVLENCYERIYHQNLFAERNHGLFLIRGENVVLMGEIVRLFPPPVCLSKSPTDALRPIQDLDKEDDVPLKQVEYHLLEPYHLKELDDKKIREEAKAHTLLHTKGFSKEGGEGDGY
jgi:U6 snRNA-associated Sm-like protein LSm1